MDTLSFTNGRTGYLLKAVLAALYAMKEHVELLLWPCWHKSVHHVAGCADAPAGSKKGVVVQLVMTWAISRYLSREDCRAFHVLDDLQCITRGSHAEPAASVADRTKAHLAKEGWLGYLLAARSHHHHVCSQETAAL